MAGFGRRVRYYLIGVILGSLVVYAMFGNRSDIGCDYLPNARVLKNLRTKAHHYSSQANCHIECLALDSMDIAMMFAAGAVKFSESEPRKEPCGEYVLLTKLPDEREINMRVQNCDSTVTILSFRHDGTTCDCDLVE
jgi:hypothetical protein